MSRQMWNLKKLHATDRPMTTPLFLLRCVQLGISIRDLDLLTIGMVNDMYAESSNDEYKGYRRLPRRKTLIYFSKMKAIACYLSQFGIYLFQIKKGDACNENDQYQIRGFYL